MSYSTSERVPPLFVTSEPALALLLLPLLPAGPHQGRNVREQQRSSKHEACPQPVVRGEWVFEVQDREEETEELPECDDQGDGEAGALRGQHEHRGDADVLGDHVPKEVEQHDRQLDVDERDGNWLTREENIPVVEDVGSQQQEAGQWQGVSVEESLLRVLPVLAVDDLTRNPSTHYTTRHTTLLTS